MLYGPSGTGKTEMVQYLGYKLGLPVTTFSCSANTDEYDLLGKPISLGVTGEGDGKIVYTETELTKAIKNGWVIEIQEAQLFIRRNRACSAARRQYDNTASELYCSVYYERQL